MASVEKLDQTTEILRGLITHFGALNTARPIVVDAIHGAHTQGPHLKVPREHHDAVRHVLADMLPRLLRDPDQPTRSIANASKSSDCITDKRLESVLKRDVSTLAASVARAERHLHLILESQRLLDVLCAPPPQHQHQQNRAAA